MQSEKRKLKRIMSGRQNPMPNSQKIAPSSLNNASVFRHKKFTTAKKDVEALPYDPSEHLY